MISTPYTNDNPTPIRRKIMSKAMDTAFDETGMSLDEDGEILGAEETAAIDQADKARKIAAIKQGVKTLPFALNTVVSYSKQLDQDAAFKQQIRTQNQQKPIWDYNSMYGDNQPIIKAAKGAEVRSSSSESLPFKIDDGEFLMLPDGKLEHVKGSSNKTDDVSTILPNGTKIFSNTLKPINSKDTFATIAKKHDYTDEMTKLENPYTSPVSRTSAERMLQRKQKALNTLFEEQQALNGNSNGEIEEREFAEGGTAGPKPIYVNSKNDPRLQRYNDSNDLYNFYTTQKRLEKQSDFVPSTFWETLTTGEPVKLTDQGKKNRDVVTATAKTIMRNNPRIKKGLYGHPLPPDEEYDEKGSYDLLHPAIKPKGTWKGTALNNDYSNVKPKQLVEYREPTPTGINVPARVNGREVGVFNNRLVSRTTQIKPKVKPKKAVSPTPSVETTKPEVKTVTPAPVATEVKKVVTPTAKPVAKKSVTPSANIVRNAQTGWDTPKVKIVEADGTEKIVTKEEYEKWAASNPKHEKHFKMGGKTCNYEEGGLYSIDKSEYQRLLKLGHKIEIIED